MYWDEREHKCVFVKICVVTEWARERVGRRRLEGKQKTLELGKMEDGTNQRKGLDNSRHTYQTVLMWLIETYLLRLALVEVIFTILKFLTSLQIDICSTNGEKGHYNYTTLLGKTNKYLDSKLLLNFTKRWHFVRLGCREIDLKAVWSAVDKTIEASSALIWLTSLDAISIGMTSKVPAKSFLIGRFSVGRRLQIRTDW